MLHLCINVKKKCKNVPIKITQRRCFSLVREKFHYFERERQGAQIFTSLVFLYLFIFFLFFAYRASVSVIAKIKT